jgi:hypothetical protein
MPYKDPLFVEYGNINVLDPDSIRSGDPDPDPGGENDPQK